MKDERNLNNRNALRGASMMETFQKPENALKRANELQSVGQDTAALRILHSVINQKKFRAQRWDTVQEKIMMRFVQLCVELQKLKVAREGLHHYRYISQHSNLASLGKVITELRDQAEARLEQAKSQSDSDKISENIKDDLDSEESPEALMLSTLQIEIRDPVSRNVHTSLRFLWDVYKMILDILRTAPRMEKTYHETARKAFEFCLVNNRPQEFKRLCEVMRMHYGHMLKYKDKPHVDGLLRPELHLETRMTQLHVGTELKLWRESSNIAEDINNFGLHDLFLRSFRYSREANLRKREELLRWLAIFYEKMAMIFWVSENYLFHSLAWLKYLFHVRNFKKNVSEENSQKMCSISVLTVLCIPVGAIEKKIDDYGQDASERVAEQQKMMITLLGHTSVPNRVSLMQALTSKDILRQSSNLCQKMFDLVENKFSPLKLCSESLPLLEELEEAELGQYMVPLKRVIFHKLLLQLSQVYTCVSIDYFTQTICTKEFFPWTTSEKMIVDLVRRSHVQMRIDYSKKAMYFGAASIDPAASMKHQLSNMSRQLDAATRMIYSNGTPQQFELELQAKALLSNITDQIQVEFDRVQERKKENDDRRKVEAKAVQEKKLKEKKELEEDEKIEKKRREEAIKLREAQRRKEGKVKERTELAQQIIEDVRASCSKSQFSKLMIKGKTPDELVPKDILENVIEYEDVEKAQDYCVNQERQEKIRQRKLEAKRLDHFVRACRQEELPLLTIWMEETLENDTKFLMKMQSKHEEAHQISFNEALQEKQIFEAFVDVRQKWFDEQMITRRELFDEEMQKAKARDVELRIRRKIQRAKERKEEHIRALQEEEEKHQRELQKKQLEKEMRAAQELEAKKLQAEQEEKAKLKRLDEIAEIQRMKELEISARLVTDDITPPVVSRVAAVQRPTKVIPTSWRQEKQEETTTVAAPERVSARRMNIQTSAPNNNFRITRAKPQVKAPQANTELQSGAPVGKAANGSQDPDNDGFVFVRKRK